MQPDIRSVELLTPEIIITASAWMLLSGEYGFLMPSIPAHDILRKSQRVDDCRCYPCESAAPFKPVPWPMLPGEEEIKEWRGMAPGDDCLPTELDGMWDLENDAGYTVAPLGVPINGRDGMHPAPRIGDTGPVWVWEVDR